MGALIDITGQKFARLLVVGRADKRGGSICWHCKCDCGKELIVRGYHLKSGHTLSCGCFSKDRTTTHGMTKSTEYQSWRSMIQRCANPNNASYKHYGGRGIRVCDRWINSFENFYADMGEKPKGMSIDRVDNNGNYEPKNCRWSSHKGQHRNKRSNTMITFRGKTQCLQEWSDETGISEDAISIRLRKLNWSIEKALTTPNKVSKKYKGVSNV